MTGTGLKATETSGGLLICLHVQPRAKRCEVSGLHNGALKIKVTAPPVDDAANRALIDFLSRVLGTPKSNFQILGGEKSRDKTLKISGMSLSEFQTRISRHCSL